jgi:hypothetical protein
VFKLTSNCVSIDCVFRGWNVWINGVSIFSWRVHPVGQVDHGFLILFLLKVTCAGLSEMSHFLPECASEGDANIVHLLSEEMTSPFNVYIL